MAQILVSDIDGVLTDGTVLLDSRGSEHKLIFFRDLDALFQMQKAGWTIAFLTGEKGPWVNMIKERLPHKYFFDGCKDKRKAILRILKEEGAVRADIFYIGDGLSDIAAMAVAGVSVCPSDAAPETMAAATFVLKAKGGRGALEEFVRWLRMTHLPKGGV